MNMTTAGTKVYDPGVLVLGSVEQPDGDADQRQSCQQLVGSAERLPEDLPGRDRFARGIFQGDEDQEHRQAAGQDGGEDSAKPTLPTGEFLDNIAAQAGADIQCVIDEGGEGHQTKGNAKRRADPDQFHEGADARGINEVRRLGQQSDCLW